MAKSKTVGGGRGSLEPLSAWKRHQALQELARFMGKEGRAHLTQLEYDLAEEKAYSVQFFVRHWGSWARAVEKARELVDQQEIPEPEPSPYAGWVSCLCGKACHCENAFGVQTDAKSGCATLAGPGQTSCRWMINSFI